MHSTACVRDGKSSMSVCQSWLSQLFGLSHLYSAIYNSSVQNKDAIISTWIIQKQHVCVLMCKKRTLGGEVVAAVKCSPWGLKITTAGLQDAMTGRKSHSHVSYMPAHLYIQHLVTLYKRCVNKVDYNKTWRQDCNTALCHQLIGHK